MSYIKFTPPEVLNQIAYKLDKNTCINLITQSMMYIENPNHLKNINKNYKSHYQIFIIKRLVN